MCLIYLLLQGSFVIFVSHFFFSGSDSGTETILYDPLITSRARNSSISTEIVGNIHKGQGAVSENGSDVLYALCTLDGKEIFIIQCRWALMAQLDAPSYWRQEVTGSTPAEVGNILSWRLIMKCFLRSFSPFR